MRKSVTITREQLAEAWDCNLIGESVTYFRPKESSSFDRFADHLGLSNEEPSKGVEQHPLYKMKLHECLSAHDGSLFTQAIRVPGGWIYTSIDKSHNLCSTCFVPFNNEFQVHGSKPLVTEE